MRTRLLALGIIMLVSCTETNQANSGVDPNTAAQSTTEVRLLNPKADSDVYQRLSSLEFEDFQALSRASDAVFVGRIVGVIEDYAFDGPDPEDPNGIVIVQDGIIFEVVEALKGDPGPTAVIAQPALVEGVRETEPLSGGDQERADLGEQVEAPTVNTQDRPIVVDPVPYLGDGLVALETGGETISYLVFASQHQFRSGASPDGMLIFTTASSVARVDLATGKVDATGELPFVDVPPAPPEGLSLDVIKDWISHGAPPTEVPEEFLPEPPED